MPPDEAEAGVARTRGKNGAGDGLEWSEDGALLSVAAPTFDVLITVDQNLRYQQNLDRIEIGIIGLKAVSNRIEHLSPLMPEVRLELESIQPRQYILIGA